MNQRLLNDLTRLLMREAADAPHRPVEDLLAEALRRVVFSAETVVAWRSKIPGGSSADRSGARCFDLLSPAVPLAEDELDRLLADAPRLTSAAEKDFDRQVLEGMPLRIAFGQREGDRLSALAVRLDPGPEGAPGWERVEAFREACRLNISELRWLFDAFSALKAAQAARARVELGRDVHRLLNDADTALPRRFQAAAGLLRRVEAALAQPWGREDSVRLADRLAEWALHQELGAGDVPTPAHEEGVQALCAALERVRRAAPGDLAARQGVPLADRLELIGLALQEPAGAPDPDQAPAGDPGDPSPLPLLALWAQVHRLARRADVDGRPGPAAEDAWARAAARTRERLPALLAAQGGDGWHEAAHIRNWLRLWFALQLLQPPPGVDAPDRLEPGTRLDSEKWRFRADLSYVLQESLRFATSGGRRGYLYQPASFSSALRTLVEAHARLEVRLPREQDVRAHLQEIAEVRGVDSYQFAAGHLQHVLEIYIAGHFFCSLALGGPLARYGRLGDALASRSGSQPGPQALSEFRAAFSLAALFHDVGVLLFPSHSPTDALCRDDPALARILGEVSAQVCSAGRSLLDRCAEDLRAGGCIDATEAGIARWIEAQRACGQPDHALLGAWYLLRISQAVEALRPEVVRAAVRAILLHAAVGQAIDPDRDPAAALLVLCDEIFDWDPAAHPGPAPNAVGRTLSALAADLPPHRSRSSRVRLAGLRVAVSGAGVVASLEMGEIAGDRCWPRFELELQEALEAPTLRAWLTMAQNLGRVRRSQAGWGPDVTLHARIPPRVALAVGHTHALLDRVVLQSRLPLRNRLQSWLAVQVVGVEEERERFLLLPLAQLLAVDSLRPHLPVLMGEVFDVLEELERQRRP